MQRVSEMDMEQIEETLRGLDWREIEKLRVFGDYNDKVIIYTDGTIGEQDSSTYYRDSEAAGVLAYLTCWGLGNVDTMHYTEGWTQPEVDEDGIETGRYVISWSHDNPDNGTVLDLAEIVARAIDEGDMETEGYIDEVLDDVRQWREELDRRKLEVEAEREWEEEVRRYYESFKD